MPTPSPPPVRALAVHLPQFHPISENDEWWGAGFTEWRNVVRARPLARWHHQPHIPADLGFCDLRVAETRQAQADLARAHGIAGFLYYHYWFSGRRLLERPVDEILATGTPDFPFALTWANEHWARTWDGAADRVLMRQEYSDADDLAHIRHLLPVFADPRYLRVDGRPLFCVYHARSLPDSRRTTDRWRDEAARAGIGDLYLCRIEHDGGGDPAALGFDAGIDFQPDFANLGRALRRSVPERVLRRLRATPRPRSIAPTASSTTPRSSTACSRDRRSGTPASPGSRRAGTTRRAGPARASSCATPHRRSTSAGCARCSPASRRRGPTRTSS